MGETQRSGMCRLIFLIESNVLHLGDRVLLRKCYNSRNGLFDEEMFRSGRGVAGGWPWPHFFEREVHINEIQI